MLMVRHVKAPAKINLHLEVCGKLPNGYHAIKSIFQTVPLYDELDIELTETENSCRVICEKMDLPENNTISKAYRKFCEASGITQSIQVVLNKCIPSGAGLGGGSSDAASLLLALNEMFDYPLDFSQLEEVALTVGSDVPFFLKGGCALVTGQGEVIKPIPARDDLSFVLIYPDEHSSTSDAYALVDDYQDKYGNRASLDDLEGVYNKKVSEWTFYNSFTQPLFSKFPGIKKAFDDLKALDAEFVEVTGSGSTVFGVFSDSESAKAVYTKLCNDWQCRYCLLPSVL